MWDRGYIPIQIPSDLTTLGRGHTHVIGLPVVHTLFATQSPSAAHSDKYQTYDYRKIFVCEICEIWFRQLQSAKNYYIRIINWLILAFPTDPCLLAYPTGISVNPTGARKWLSCMTSARRFWRFDVITFRLQRIREEPYRTFLDRKM